MAAPTTPADELAAAAPLLCDTRGLLRDAKAWLQRGNRREVQRLLNLIDGSLEEVTRHHWAADQLLRGEGHSRVA